MAPGKVVRHESRAHVSVLEIMHEICNHVDQRISRIFVEFGFIHNGKSFARIDGVVKPKKQFFEIIFSTYRIKVNFRHVFASMFGAIGAGQLAQTLLIMFKSGSRMRWNWSSRTFSAKV